MDTPKEDNDDLEIELSTDFDLRIAEIYDSEPGSGPPDSDLNADDPDDPADVPDDSIEFRDGLTMRGWLWRVRARYRKDKCEACGIGERMQIHHIDGNYRNADPDNLQTLCVWCHRFIHHTAKRCGWKEPGRMVKLKGDINCDKI